MTEMFNDIIIKELIALKTAEISRTKADLQEYNDHHNYLISEMECELHDLHLRFEMYEAENAPPSDENLKLLCCEPLKELTDPLRLKELEMRFPGAVMVLSTEKEQLEVEYHYIEGASENEPWNHQIYCESTNQAFPSFKEFGEFQNNKLNLMAEWRGMYIGLDHLF